MISRKKWKRVMEKQEKKSALFLWIQTQLSKINYDLTDNYCRFFIRDVIQQKGMSLIIELYVQPLTGIFQSIQFKPKIFISSSNFTHRPRIYNDRRIFHPNVNMYTCEIVFPEIVRDWNPTQQFATIFHNLKYTLIEPNLKFVPNTEFNKRSAWNYHFNKKNYRNLIIENCPLYLQNIIGSQFNLESSSKMDIESGCQPHADYNQEDYWSIEVLTVRRGLQSNVDNGEFDDEEKSILLLTKQIKCLDMNEEEVRESCLAEYQME